MDITILETGSMELLSVVDPRTGVNYIEDFIGNAGGFGASECDMYSKFVRTDDVNVSDIATGYVTDDGTTFYFDNFPGDGYVTSQANYDWWRAVVDNEQELQELIEKARGMGVTGDDINDALDQPQSDLDDLIYAQKQEVTELIERHEGFSFLRNSVINAESIELLCSSLNDFERHVKDADYAGKSSDYVDYTSLPIFGGQEPVSTEGVYSWSCDTLLINDGNCWQVVERDDVEQETHTVSSVRADAQALNSKCFDKHGVFFAYSGTQFRDGRIKVGADDGEEMVSLGAGMWCRPRNVEAFLVEFDEIIEQSKRDMLEKVGVDALIVYELSNHECYYTYNIDSACDALECYDITDRELVKKIFYRELPNHEDYY